jgi:enterochelin esterase-like enzyme
MRARAMWVAALWMSTASALAQPPADVKPAEAAPPRPSPPPAIVSPEVHADRKVTFRLRAPAAKEVLITGEWSRERTPLVKDASGDWSVTLGPLPGDLYGYSFVADGLMMADPLNAWLKLARSPRTSIVEVPGDPPRLHELRSVPRGAVRIQTYDSKALGQRRPLWVYTPPDYDKDAARRYPVFYLLHGSGDNEATWTSAGRLNVMLDNLIAQGKARPMLVVMPDGHTVYPPPPGPEAGLQNVEAFERDLVGDVLPFVDASYRTDRSAAGRAIAGVSMGGGHSLLIGLRHTDLFAWVVGLSSSVFDPEATLAKTLADPKGTNARLKLLWFAVAKTDRLLEGNQKLADLLKAKGIACTFTPVDGDHSWPQWRRYMEDVAPMLFVTSAK